MGITRRLRYVALGRQKNGVDTERSADLEATARMMRKLRTQRGEQTSRKRKWIAEPPFAWIKSVLGFDRLHLRGLRQVKGEWDPACLSANLRRMHSKMAWT
jgi:hypothetical protein